MRIFMLAGKEHKSPVVIESVTLPCLKILQRVMQPPPAAAGVSVEPAQPAPSTSTAPAKVRPRAVGFERLSSWSVLLGAVGRGGEGR